MGFGWRAYTIDPYPWPLTRVVAVTRTITRTDAAHLSPSPSQPPSRADVFEAALPWVRYHAERIARKLPASSGFDAEDLVQVGSLAAWDLAATWKEDVSKFVTYAYRRVVGVMIDLVRSASACGFAGAGTRLKLQRGEPIRVDSLSRAMYERDQGSSEPVTLADTLGEWDEDHGDGAAAEFAATLRRLGEGLHGKEADAMRRYFVGCETMKAIGRGMGLSESRVSQIVGEVVQRVRVRCEALDRNRRTVFAC